MHNKIANWERIIWPGCMEIWQDWSLEIVSSCTFCWINKNPFTKAMLLTCPEQKIGSKGQQNCIAMLTNPPLDFTKAICQRQRKWISVKKMDLCNYVHDLPHKISLWTVADMMLPWEVLCSQCISNTRKKTINRTERQTSELWSI